MTSLALGSKLSSINARTRVAKAVANFLTGLPQKLVRTTRAGLATCIGPDGTVQWGPHNLCGESDTLIAWGASLLANSVPLAAAAFDGGQYAMQANTVTGTLNFGKAFTSDDTKMSLSVDVQRGNFDTGNGAFTYGFYNSSTVVDLAYITVNYATGAVALTGPQAATSIAYSKDLGNGWFRIGITVTSGIAPGQTINAYLGGVGSPSSAGLFWRMARVMVNNGTSMDYVDSTVKNRLSYPNSFNNAFWFKLYSMQVYDNTCTGPTGQPAHTLVAGAASAELYQTVTLAGVYTSGLKIRRRLGTGTVSIRNSVSNAWMPLVLTSDWAQFQNDGGTATAGQAYCDILMSTQGDQIDICDAQLNPGTTLWPYSYNPGAAPSVGPIYALRYEYDPITLAPKGALIEAQATNLLLNSAVPATQNVTTTAQSYTVSMWGTGTCTLSGTATGVLTGTGANVRTSLTVTATAGTLTATFAGSNTSGQFEAGSLTSYIPTGAGTVVRVADTSSVGYDDLCKALPWLMDTNLLANPDTPVTQSITTTAQQYTVQMQGTGTCTLSGTATGVLTGTGAGNVVTMTVTATAGTLTLTFAGSNTNGKINPGPVAQTYYPQSSKQGTIAVEADLTYGAASGGMAVVSLENTSANRVEIYKQMAGSLLYGYVNANSATPGSITSGTVFKLVVGFSPSSAGAVLNGSAESAITASAFAAAPNVLKLGNDAAGNAASSMHVRRLRIFSQNLPASTKQALTR